MTALVVVTVGTLPFLGLIVLILSLFIGRSFKEYLATYDVIRRLFCAYF